MSGLPATRQHIAWFYRGQLDLKNACRYQRLLAVARRHRVVLFTKRDCAIPQDLLSLLEDVVRTPVTGQGSVDSLLYLLAASAAFLRRHRRGPFSIIWTTPDQSVVLGVPLRWLGGRGVLWVADMWDEPRLFGPLSRRSLRYWLFWGYHQVAQRTLHSADHVIAVGAGVDVGLPRVLQEHYGVRPERMTVVTNGVDMEMFRSRGPRPDDGAFRVLYVGSIAATHGIGVLLDAVARLRGPLPNIHLTLVGPQVYEVNSDWLAGAVWKRDLEAVVDYLGPQPSARIPELVYGADVCVYSFLPGPILDDVLPMKVYEYLAMGRCVVASAIPGVRTIVAHEHNGLLYQADDPQGLAAAILRIAHEPVLRARLERSARASVAAAAWDRVNARVLNTIDFLPTTGPSPR